MLSNEASFLLGLERSFTSAFELSPTQSTWQLVRATKL